MDLPEIDDRWDYNDNLKSEANFRELVAQADAAGNDACKVEAMTQLARSLGKQLRFDDAQAVLDEAKKALTPDMHVAAIRWQLEQGRVLNTSGQPHDSIPYFEKGLDLAISAGAEYLAIDAAHMLGIVAQPDQAIAWHIKAMEMAEAASDAKARRWLGPLYNNLAWTYNDIGEHEKALSIFIKDIAFRESLGLPFEASIARWSQAATLRLLGRIEEALKIQLSLVDHPLRQRNEAEGYTHEEIGECLLLLGRATEAAPHFAIAFERLGTDPWLLTNEKERLDRLQRLAGH